MRLTKKHKQLITFALSLQVEEMAEGRNKERVIEILAHYQSKGIWGNEDGISESFFPEDEDEDEDEADKILDPIHNLIRLFVKIIAAKAKKDGIRIERLDEIDHTKMGNSGMDY